jgi:hypothetical protein
MSLLRVRYSVIEKTDSHAILFAGASGGIGLETAQIFLGALPSLLYQFCIRPTPWQLRERT